MLSDIKVGIELTKSLADIFPYIKNVTNDKAEKVEIDNHTIFMNYLQQVSKNFGMVKTIFSSDKSVPLYNFYEPMNIYSKENNKEIEIKIEESSELIDFILRKKNLSIQGTGGIGKSIFMKRILVDFIQTSTHVPIFIELKNLSDIHSIDAFEELIFNTVSYLGLKISKKNFFSSLDSGKYIFLFDGYDEIDHNLTDKIDIYLQQFINKYNENIFIISSRPGISFSSWTTFEEFNIQPLNKEKAISLARKLMVLSESENNFVESIDLKLYDSHKEFLSIPLLLTIMLITYQEAGEIPDNYTEFYEYCYNALFYKHDANKGLKRELKTKLSESDFKKILNYIALKSFTASRINFDRSYIDKQVTEASQYYKFSNKINTDDFIYDSTLGICMFINEGNYFKFSHRSFQEFFAASFVVHQTDSFFNNTFIPWMTKKSFNFQSQSTFINTLENKAYNRLIENIILPLSKYIYDEANGLSHTELIKKFITTVDIEENSGLATGFSYSGITITNNSLAKYITNNLKFSFKEELFDKRRTFPKEDKSVTINTEDMSDSQINKALEGYLRAPIIDFHTVMAWYKNYNDEPLNFEIEL